MYKKNEALSTEKCTASIKSLRVDIEEQITNGSYIKAGGSTIYNSDRKALKNKYFNLENLGVNVSLNT